MKENINIEDYPMIKKGAKPGKTSVIIACTHGNETCGIYAFNSLITDLVIESGIVIFCIGNPRALEKNERFTEMNLNRAFKEKELLTLEEMQTYEYERAQEIKLLLDDADALLDIHSSKNIPAEQFIICEPNNYFISDRLPFDKRISGFEEYEPGGTESYMNSRSKIGIGIECGQHDDPKSIDKATEAILSFLIAMEHIKGINKTQKQERLKISFLYKNINKDFILSRVFKDFEKIEKDTLIGHDGEIPVFSPFESKILFAHDCKDKINQECFLLAEIL